MKNNAIKFTLVELIVVVSIIAILMSIMLPAISGARGTAKKAVCLNNMKQIGITVVAYAEAWNGFLPRGTNSGSWDPPYVQSVLAANSQLNGSSSWQDYRGHEVNAYVNPKNKIFGGCPGVGESPLGTCLHHQISDYGFDTTHGGDGGAFPIITGAWHKMAALRFPSMAFSFIDATSGNTSSWTTQCYACNLSGIDPRHKGGSCIAIFDGHAEWHPLTWYASSSSYPGWGHGTNNNIFK